MYFFGRISLAWRNLTHRPMRFAIYLAGISFAVLLMFVQLGFWGALLDSVVAIIDRMNGDLVIVNRAKYALVVSEPFSLRRVTQARRIEGVAWVKPLYIRMAPWKIPDLPVHADSRLPPQPSRRLIRVLAFDLSSDVMGFPEATLAAVPLHQSGVALRDSQSKPIYGMCAGDCVAELCDRKIRLIGSFDLGTDFASDGNLIMSEGNYARYFQGYTVAASPLDDVEVGIVKLKPGANLATVKRALEAEMPDDVRVRTRAEYMEDERDFWKASTPIGFIFFLGLVVGFAVGVIICSQILSTDVGDHLSEYATLKAIGYTNRYLTGVVLKEALLLSLLGFLPGILVSSLVYLLLEALTGLPLRMTWEREATVLFCTVLMCVLSGFVALGKVWVTDPAEVF